MRSFSDLMLFRNRKESSSFSKRVVLHRKTAHSVAQNDSFRRAEWAVFECKMSQLERSGNVKKTQVVCFLPFITFSYFECTHPSAFYFVKPAVISYKIRYFVSIIQCLLNRHLRRKTEFSTNNLYQTDKSSGKDIQTSISATMHEYGHQIARTLYQDYSPTRAPLCCFSCPQVLQKVTFC